MILSDAEYAKALEDEEARSIEGSKSPNLTEIMDMEMALAIYNNDLVCFFRVVHQTFLELFKFITLCLKSFLER